MLNCQQTLYLIYLTGIGLEITIHSAGLVPCDLLDQKNILIYVCSLHFIFRWFHFVTRVAVFNSI